MGIFIGSICGYTGKMLDNVLMRFMDAIMAFPGILLAIALMTALGASLANVCIALGIRYTPVFARLIP